MRKLSAILLICMFLMCLCFSAWAADWISTPATGFTCAEDVEYTIVNGTVVNWGARGENCTFLTTYAQSYYEGSYSWETLSEKGGGTGTSDAYTSQLYQALQDMMTAEHSHQTSYGETRYLYCYTDCLQGDYSQISSFYSGQTLSGTWDSGKTWNREHTWPNSKGLNGNDENDLMMLRPTSVSENSSRGNTAYGEGSSYFDPGESVRGDCARIVLYVYVRWGNTGKMWGTGGVMESLDILLKWMEEDPVDTWEMGRNDAVQSITGVRNVFVDYPEYAWLLFGQEIPEGIVTPSGSTVHQHSYTSAVTASATCTQSGMLTYTCDCGHSYTEIIPATGHQYTQTVTPPTCTEDGYTTYLCTCGDSYTAVPTPALGHKDFAPRNHQCDRCNEDLGPCTDDNGDGLCDWCDPSAIMRGDMDGDGDIDSDDAIYLLYFTFQPEDYPINQSGDVDGDGDTDSDDAIYLLYFTFQPNDYPLFS